MQKKDILIKIQNLFYNRSFAQVSMNEIAISLNIKKASLYYYFPSKEVLISELLDFSYEEYSDFLIKILELKLPDFIQKFVYYPQKSKNIFSVINQNWYSEYKNSSELIQKRQKEVFEIIYTYLQKKYAMNKERSFLLLCILEEIGKKRCINGDCPLDMKNLIWEIQKIFIF